MARRALPLIVVICFVLGTLSFPSDASGQAQTRWLNIGELHHKFASTGMEPELMAHEGLRYPGVFSNGTHYNRRSLWIGTESHTTPDGETYAPRLAHTGPRVFNLDEFFPKQIRTISRFEPPTVIVDGVKSFQDPVTVDEVDPSMNADRMIVREANTVLGVTMRNEVRAFSNPYHDSYFIYEYTFTNTGNVDSDSEVELPDQTLEDVMIYNETKYQYMWQWTFGGSGTNTMNDVVTGNPAEDPAGDYEVDFRAIYGWLGTIRWDQANSLGAPSWNNGAWITSAKDSTGRLAAPEFVARATIHADQSPSDSSDDRSQPARMGTVRGGDPITNTNSAWNQDQMEDEYAYVHPEQTYRDYDDDPPHHADVVAPDEPSDCWECRMAKQTAPPTRGHDGGWISNISWGPYTLEPGESIKLVLVEGFAGLSLDAAVKIGEAYKESGGDDDLAISYDANGDGEIDDKTGGSGIMEGDEKMTKNMWVLTGRDSLWQMLDRARAAYDADYAVPREPRPPKRFEVTSGTDKITLEWETYSGHQPPNGWEIYRTRNRFQGAIEDDWKYQLVAELPGSARSFEDSDVVRGLQYYYYIQAVGEVNTNSTGNTPTGVKLKSNRYYTQTFIPASLKRPAGESLSDVRVVPNPYDLGSSQDVRWPGQQDRMAFLEVPGECTITIYTETGELVEQIEHTDGSGDEFWDLTTESNQVVVSGVYLALIQDHNTGEQTTRRFVVVR